MNRVALLICLALLLPVSGCDGPPFRSRPSNIVVVMMDTLRPDHLGAYGYDNNTSPNIDAIAARGTLFTTVYSVSNWTNPAIKSIFTGQYPQSVMREAKHKDAIRMPLPEEVVTFAELLQSAGYRTAGLVDHPGLSSNGNWDQGFESYEMLYQKGAEGRGSWGKSSIEYVAGQFEKKVDEFGDDPFLVYLHLVYPHWPYRAPSPWKGMFGPDDYESYSPQFAEELINSYDSQIRRMDDLVGYIDGALQSRGLLENTWLILVSDHGESFWEHGFREHGNVFFDQAIRVPLIIAPPTRSEPEKNTVEVPVSNIDVFSSILDIAGVKPPEGTHGYSLISEEARSRHDPSRFLFSTSPHSFDIEAATVFHNGFKYSRYPNVIRGQDQLFNIVQDPTEKQNLWRQMPDLVSQLQEALEQHKTQCEIDREWLAQEIQEPDDETLEGLKSLGYTQ